MNRTQKEQVVEQLRSDLGQAKSVILTSYQGLEVNTVNELRANFRKNGVEYHVVKNTLVRLAIKDTELEVMTDQFTGPIAIAYSFEDAVSPAKVIKDFAKGKEEKFQVRGGFLEGQILDVNGIQRLADMPTKEELQVKLLLLFKAVPTKFVRTLTAAPQKFLLTLQARKMQLEEEAA